MNLGDKGVGAGDMVLIHLSNISRNSGTEIFEKFISKILDDFQRLFVSFCSRHSVLVPALTFEWKMAASRLHQCDVCFSL